MELFASRGTLVMPAVEYLHTMASADRDATPAEPAESASIAGRSSESLLRRHAKTEVDI